MKKLKKLNYVESTNIPNGDELAAWAEKHIIENELQPDDVESCDMLIKACRGLRWESIPQTGGLDIVWV